LPKFTGASTIGNSQVFDDGTNVGINNPGPIYILDAYSTGTGTARIRIQGTTNFAVTQAQNSSGILYMGIDSSTAGGFGFGNYSRLILSTSNYPLVFGVNSAESMRIWGATGNVNIGTTPVSDSGFKLDVNGTGRFSGALTGNSNSNTFGNASLSGRAVIIQSGSTNQAIMFKNSAGGDGTLFINGTSTTVDYNFNTYSVGDALVIKNNGNVGIGTTLPSGIINGKGLVIYDSLYPRLILQNSTTGTGTGAFTGLYLIGNTMYIQNSTIGEINFAVNSASDAMVLTAAGKLLIGTPTSGASKLRIVGLPTSAAGLSSGDVYSLAGTLMIA
jgi:hypothetical protein